MDLAEAPKQKEKEPLTPLQEIDCKLAHRFGRLLRVKGASSTVRVCDRERATTYHVMSRTVGGEFLLDDVAKEAFRKLMWKMAKFCGVEVLTYCVMDNHFHILLTVPEQAKWLQRFEGEGGEEKLMRHLSTNYSKAFVGQLRAELAELRAENRQLEAEILLQSFKERLCDLSRFVKELKERFTRWYNKHYARRGTLWMARFKSVMLEGPGRCVDPLNVKNAALTMANYIDLNPVRAGICEDPKDYRFCGYAEAVAGSKRARRGLNRVQQLPLDDWEFSKKGRSSGAERYRMLLFGNAQERKGNGEGVVFRKGVKAEAVEEVMEKRGKLSRAEILRCRVRYFTQGRVLGGQAYVMGLRNSAVKNRDRAVEVVAGLFVPRRISDR